LYEFDQYLLEQVKQEIEMLSYQQMDKNKHNLKFFVDQVQDLLHQANLKI